MMLLALAIGIILTRTLLRDRRTRWQQSPFLLTANHPVKEDDDDNDNDAASTEESEIEKK
jgi:membrane protein